VIQGAQFRHEIFASPRRTDNVLYVFIEGDGSPWADHGTVAARDPTPLRPLALELAARTAHSVLYLGRPCYFHVHADRACSTDLWTSARYSRAVVDSMVAATNRYAASGGFAHVILIGYSGGGALAVLMAPAVRDVRAVITIAANLDVADWVDLHGYLPLERSLDPASQPPLSLDIEQRHLIGERDINVPESVNGRYLRTLGVDRIWRYSTFDHVCCWVQQWPAILERIDRDLPH
jgi:pimeloyl-ACP methyl ester carboxylesterase